MLKKFLNCIFSIFDNNIFFIGAVDKLPPPLSKEDEIKYVSLSQDGDIKARNKLIEHNLRLVVFLAKRYENTGYEFEDLVSIGTLGLIKAVKTYRLDKNIKLATYASRCIDNEILMYLRKNKKRKSEISLEDSLSYDSEGNELRLEDILGTDDDLVTKNIENVQERKMLIKEINDLNERDRKIMIMRYGLFNTKEVTQKDVAEKLGISQSYISRIEKKVIKRLKEAIK